MHITNLKKIGLGLCAAALAASCSISTTMDESIDKNINAASHLREDSKIPTRVENQDLVKVNDDIWLGNSSKIEYEGEPLPSYLESKDGITLVSNRPITLYEIGDMINRTTSLGIRYASDLEEDVRSKGENNRPGFDDSSNTDWVSPDTMMVSYQGPLSGFLDEVSSRFGVWWKYENRDIYFYKFITKTFVIYSLPSKPSMNVSIGGSASGSGNSSSISLSSSIEVEMWAQFEKSIEAMISEGAKLTVSPADGTITLTATPNDIKLVAKYINEQNVRLSRQVAISAKIMQVTITDSDTYGLDLKASFGDGVTSIGVTGTQGLAAENTSSALTWGVVKKNWSADAIVQAISEKNRATLVTSGTVTTLNNKPAPIQVTQKQNYISEMTKTNNGTDGSNYDISVTTEEVETGFTLDVLPRILEHGRLLLMFNMTLSDLLSLEKVSFGNADENQYVQNPKIESRAFTQEVAMTSGESLILTGYEKVSSNTDKTGTGSAENSLLGGQASASKERNILVIVLTPIVLETPLSPETRMTMN
jgi:type IVB pilus formation R64 PilN family outer membrane protein